MTGIIRCSPTLRQWVIALILLQATPSQDAVAGGLPENFVHHEEARELGAISFKDNEGRTLGLADYAGRVVLLNIWATWCGPCREEMSTLNDLQARLGSKDFEVVALSIDRAGPEPVRAFFAELNLSSLRLYIDETGVSARAAGVIGLPTTLLIDRQGRELGRLVGPAEWNAPDVVTYIGSLIERSKRAGLNERNE